MKCLDTRRRPECLKARRYRAEHGGIVQTVEIPLVVLRGVVPLHRLQPRMDAWRRNQERLKRRSAALDLIRQGWKPEAVAHELSLNVRTVQHYRKGTR